MEKDDGQVGACVCNDAQAYVHKESKQGHGYSVSPEEKGL